mmetsp:Transcript_6420/g.7348  ORF Transcript_6420/g.7348 Transcript_6420/m.7348 type:complete len:197 (+) Transcript_6420:34-624(+)
MVKFGVLVAAIAFVSTEAFVPQHQSFFPLEPLAATSEVDNFIVDDLGNNLAIKQLLTTVQEKSILKQVAQSGLLSKAKKAGVSLANLERVLELGAKNPDVLVLAEAAGPDILPLLPTLAEAAPAALPILTFAVSVRPVVLGGIGLLSIVFAAGTVILIPDDTVAQVAIQTLAVGVLGLGVPALSLGGASVLSSLTK